MAREDDYREAFRLASEELKKANLHRMAKLAGASIRLEESGDVELALPLLGVRHLIQVGEQVTIARDHENREVPLPNQVLLSHYLLNSKGEAPSGELITFRQVPDGHFYFDAFQRRARDPFLKAFGEQPELFQTCARMLAGEPVDHGDVGMAFQVLPRIAIQLVLWTGDEEFPPEASVLFDANIVHYLPAEDIAYLSGSLVYTLMGMARSVQARQG